MNKTAIKLLCVLCCLAVVVTGISVLSADDTDENITQNIFTPSFQTVKQEPAGKSAGESLSADDVLVCENARLALYLNEDDFIIKVMDKEGNYIWSSAANHNYSAEMTGTWKRFSSAFLTMDYFNQTGAILRSSARYSSSTANLKLSSDGIEATLKFQEPDATARVYITLEEKGFTVRVPDDEIIFNKEVNRLAKLYVMPFFGSVYSDSVPGYFFIPDGCGALMRFDKPKTYNSSTLLRVYGKDESVTSSTSYQSGAVPTSPKQINIPIYGAVHGNMQNAFMGTVTSGQAYSAFEISPAGVKIDFHWMSPVFVYREQYRQSTGSSVGYDVVQSVQNTVNPQITYTLLSGEDADYVGMAKEYRQRLLDNGMLPEDNGEKDDIPLLINALMSDQSKSLFGNTAKVLTSLDDVENWNESLKNNGIENIFISLFGFEKGGFSGGKTGDFSVSRKIGSEKQLQSISETMSSQGGGLFISKDFARAFEGQTGNSHFLYAINRVFTSVSDGGRLYSLRYFLDIPTITEQFEKALDLPKYKQNLMLPAVGNTLYSNYKENRETTRDDGISAVTDGLSEIKKAGGTVALDNPAEYALAFTDIIYDTDMEHSHYIFETDTVPFMQIVTSGRITSFSPYLNMNAGNETLILQMIDYNIYPSYMLTEAESHELAKCNISYLYSSCFDDYLQDISSTYERINSVLSEVSGAVIEDRICPQDGVSVTEYSNGKSVIVNYNGTAVSYGNVSVPAYSAECIGK